MLGGLNKKLNYDGRFLLGQDLDLTSDETDTILFSRMGAILAVSQDLCQHSPSPLARE